MKGYYPSLTIYHPSPLGVDSALRLELLPFVYGDPNSGKLVLNLAPQDDDGYNWSHAITVILDFEDVARMLMVFRGETESINYGKGITRRDCRFNMTHVIEPVCGYKIMLSDGNRTYEFMLYPAEALGISLALERSMAKLVFEMEG